MTLTYVGFSYPLSRTLSEAFIGCKTRIEVIIFSIATYLNRSSQARVMTEAGRGVAGIINLTFRISWATKKPQSAQRTQRNNNSVISASSVVDYLSLIYFLLISLNIPKIVLWHIYMLQLKTMNRAA
jgi:hypothetical protein